MDNYTTAETAWKLKEKGFPQPSMNDDQIWYDKIGVPFKSNKFSNLNLKHWAYAPTPADIMAELTPDYFLMRDFPVKGIIYWQCKSKNYQSEKHINPAEACALAYLAN